MFKPPEIMGKLIENKMRISNSVNGKAETLKNQRAEDEVTVAGLLLKERKVIGIRG